MKASPIKYLVHGWEPKAKRLTWRQVIGLERPLMIIDSPDTIAFTIIVNGESPVTRYQLILSPLILPRRDSNPGT